MHASFNLMLFSLFLATPCGLQDSSCLIEDGTLCPLRWKHGVTTTGLPGKPSLLFLEESLLLILRTLDFSHLHSIPLYVPAITNLTSFLLSIH